MIRLTVFLASVLLFSAAAEAADKPKGCAGKKPFNTKINIHLEIPDPKYNHKLSVKKLTNNQAQIIKDWKTEYEDHVWAAQDLYVMGLARGGIGVTSSSSFLGKAYDRYGMYYCPYVRELNINVFYNTQIFIASDLKKDTCRFNTTLDHELLHHTTNVTAVEDVLIQLKKDLPKIIAYMEKHYVPKDEVQNGFNNLNQGLHDAIEIYGQYIFEEIEKRNKPIDSPENYERTSNLCPQ